MEGRREGEIRTKEDEAKLNMKRSVMSREGKEGEKC